MEPKNNRWMLMISGIAAIFITSMLLADLFEPPFYRLPWMRPENPHMFPTYMLPVYLGFALFAIVPLSYYLITKRMDEKMDASVKLISKLAGKAAPAKAPSAGRNMIMRFLPPAERKIVEKLIEGKGIAIQAEISRMDGMNKLKVHRAVKDLELKGIIKAEAHGKTKRLIMAKDVMDAMKN